MNKSNDKDWFRVTTVNPEGTRWTGKCWYIHNLLKYEFDLQFDIPVTYPSTTPEIELPHLDGKTQKMYRGEIPVLVDSGMIKHKDDATISTE
ncbi:hypothetical protein BUALT_Bualt03G0207400 [Buddleja alternifolia]|uniref:Ubiquitin-fold modifier-conjugating enzyme 1 n=1 Tax=Buddleja alternifolia TaxID=168488 RepID=A0AAV6Y298_9LAMI|nr:hypothetical protein BUALT_Bualt03G0207400 [Buddleja alternifolia]